MKCHLCGGSPRVTSKVVTARFPDVAVVYLRCPGCRAEFQELRPIVKKAKAIVGRARVPSPKK